MKYIFKRSRIDTGNGEDWIVSNSMSCCQVKERIAIAKDAFNRKRTIFNRTLGKELKKSLVKCFVLYSAETWTLRRSEEKQLEAFEMWIWRRIGHVK